MASIVFAILDFSEYHILGYESFIIAIVAVAFFSGLYIFAEHCLMPRPRDIYTDPMSFAIATMNTPEVTASYWTRFRSRGMPTLYNIIYVYIRDSYCSNDSW